MDRVPNSTDIAELVKQFGKDQAALAGMVKSSLDSLRTFASIKIDKKVKDSLKKMKDVKSTFNTYSYAVRDMIDGVSNLLPKNASPDELNATLSVLSGDPKKTLELFSDNGKKISTETTDEKKGVLDIIGTTLGLIKQIAEVQPPKRRKLNKTIQSYSDTVTMLWSFVRELGNAADPTAALESAKASKTITDAMLNLTGIFTGIQKDLLPLSEAVAAFEPSLKRGMKLLYDPEADPEKQFSIISTVVGAAKHAEKINGDKVKQLGALGDSVNKAAKSMAVGIGILGLKAVSDKVLAGAKTLNEIIYDVIECSNLAAGIDPNDMKNFVSAVSSITTAIGTLGALYIKIHKAAAESWLFKTVHGREPLQWLSGVFDDVRVNAPGPETEKNTKTVEKIVSMMLSSVQHINDMTVKLIVAVPKAVIASSMFSWMIDRLRVSLYSASCSLDEAEIKKTEEAFTALASIGSSMDIFVRSMPSRREMRRALSTMLVVGDMLGDKEVQTQFKEAIAAIDLMVGEKDSLVQLNSLLDTVASAIKSAAQAGVWCALAIPGMMLVGLAAKVMEKVVYQLMMVMSGFSKGEIEDMRQQFEDLGKMVLLAGATVAVCALVGVFVILALPEILLGFAAIASVVIVFAGLLRLIDLITGGSQFKSNAEAIADLGSLILLAGAVIAISVLVGLLVIKAFRLILVGFAALMTVTVALIGVLWLIGKVGEIPGLKTGMLMMIAMIMSMMLAALMITIVSRVGAGIDLVGILKFTMTLAIITAAYIGLGLLMATGGIIAVTLATAGIILISLSMLMITGAIASVNNALSKTDQEQTKDNIAAMLDTMKYTVDYVNDNFSIADMGKAAAKMFLMANMSKHLMRMANRIQRIASLTMDEFDEAGHPTGKIVKMKTQDFIDAAVNGIAVAQTIAAMFDSEPTVITTSAGSFTVAGLSDDVLEGITTKNKRKIRQLSKITKFIGKMATTVADIASLNMATEWNADGKPLSFQKMTTQDFVNASLNGTAVAKLMAALLDENETVIETSVGNVTVKGIPEAAFEKITNSAKRKFRQLNKITKFIGRMTETVAKIASLKIATEWNADGKPINFEAITTDQMKDAALNATAIVKFFAAVATNQNTMLTMAGGQTFTVEATTENMFKRVDRELKRKFRFLGRIVNTIACATKTVTDTAALRIPTEWNADGKPIKYEPITPQQMQEAAENVVTIMTTLTDAIVSPEMTAKLDSFDRSQKRAMERMFTAVTPITSMVETVVALAGGSLEEYDASGHPTGKQVNVLKALEAKPDIINGIVSIYSIFTDALAVITGQDSAAEVTVTQSKGLLGRMVNKVASAVTAVVDAGISMVKNIQSRMDTNAAAKNIDTIIDPITSMIDTVKKLNEAMSSVDLTVGDGLKTVMLGTVDAIQEVGSRDLDKAKTDADSAKTCIESITTVIKKIKNIIRISDGLEEGIRNAIKNVIVPIDEMKDINLDSSVKATDRAAVSAETISSTLNMIGKLFKRVETKTLAGTAAAAESIFASLSQIGKLFSSAYTVDTDKIKKEVEDIESVIDSVTELDFSKAVKASKMAVNTAGVITVNLNTLGTVLSSVKLRQADKIENIKKYIASIVSAVSSVKTMRLERYSQMTKRAVVPAEEIVTSLKKVESLLSSIDAAGAKKSINEAIKAATDITSHLNKIGATLSAVEIKSAEKIALIKRYVSDIQSSLEPIKTMRLDRYARITKNAVPAVEEIVSSLSRVTKLLSRVDGSSVKGAIKSVEAIVSDLNTVGSVFEKAKAKKEDNVKKCVESIMSSVESVKTIRLDMYIEIAKNAVPAVEEIVSSLNRVTKLLSGVDEPTIRKTIKSAEAIVSDLNTVGSVFEKAKAKKADNVKKCVENIMSSIESVRTMRLDRYTEIAKNAVPAVKEIVSSLDRVTKLLSGVDGSSVKRAIKAIEPINELRLDRYARIAKNAVPAAEEIVSSLNKIVSDLSNIDSPESNEIRRVSEMIVASLDFIKNIDFATYSRSMRRSARSASSISESIDTVVSSLDSVMKLNFRKHAMSAENAANAVKEIVSSLNKIIGIIGTVGKAKKGTDKEINSTIKSIVHSINEISSIKVGNNPLERASAVLRSSVGRIKESYDIATRIGKNDVENLKNMVYGCVSAISKIDDNDFALLRERKADLNSYIDTIERFMAANKNAQAADNVHRTMEDTGKFVVQLNKVSDTKLEKMASISKNMADFARKINGNFDKLADAMNEKMVKALEKVDKTLKEVNKTMNEMPGKLKNAVGSIPNGGGYKEDDYKEKKTASANGTTKNPPQQKPQQQKGKPVTGKTLNNCIVQVEDGYALAVVQKYE